VAIVDASVPVEEARTLVERSGRLEDLERLFAASGV
jgi:hypothetical protein